MNHLKLEDKVSDIVRYCKSSSDPIDPKKIKEFTADILAIVRKERYAPIYNDKDTFETALDKAWFDYDNGSRLVDQFEDNYAKLAHAKGFREGFLFGNNK